MADITVEALFDQAQRLSVIERLRMLELLAQSLQAEVRQTTDWKAALRATYGILADDPIERPPQMR